MPMNVFYITNTSSDDFSVDILTAIMIIFIKCFVKYRGHLFASGNVLNHYILRKT